MDYLKLIAEGEGERVEFKATPKDISKLISAFANAEGGYIFIGISDERKVVGADIEKAKEAVTASLLSLTPKPKIKMKVIEIEGKKVLVVRVYPSASLVNINGTAYIRVGRGVRKLELAEILSESAEKLLFEFDESISEVSVKEADKELIKWLNNARERRGLSSRGDVLEALRLKKGEKLTFAGVLFLTREPQLYYPYTSIRVLYEDNSWKILKGSFKELFEKAMDELRKEIRYVTLSRAGRRVEFPTYSIKALREALVNALTHRNYAIPSEIFIHISKKGITIENPGSFPHGVSLEHPKPIPRNRWIYETAFQVGYVEKIGSGLRVMIEEAKNNPLFDIKVQTEPHWTRVSFISLQPQLTREEEEILGFLDKERSSSELAALIGRSKPTTLKLLKNLEKLGMVERIGRGKSTVWRRT